MTRWNNEWRTPVGGIRVARSREQSRTRSSFGQLTGAARHVTLRIDGCGHQDRAPGLPQDMAPNTSSDCPRNSTSARASNAPGA